MDSSVPSESLPPLDDVMISIGAADSSPEYTFDRIHAAFPVGDTLFAVIDQGSSAIRIYSRTGDFVRALGRSGAGPGEFVGLQRAWASTRGDTIIAWDVQLNRVSYWRSSGELLAVERIPLDFFPMPVGRFADGSLLALRRSSQRRLNPGDVQAVQAAVFRLRTDTGIAVHLVDVPWETIAAGVSSRGGSGVMYVPQPFTTSATIAVSDSQFYYSSGEDYLVQRFNWNGEHIGAIRVAAGEPDPITTEQRENWVAEQVDGSPPEVRPGVRRFLESLRTPEHRPALDRLLVDDEGDIWVRKYGEDPVRAWVVLSSDGRVLQTFELPASFEPKHIGSSMVVGVVTDADGVQTVAVKRPPQKGGT